MPDYRQELVDRYATTHGSHFAEKDAAWYAARARDFDRRLRPWLPADRGAPLLDLACGAGEFLVHAKALGYTNARGVDLSEEQLAQARRVGATNVERADLFEHLKANHGLYEFILASHIIEHLQKSQTLEFLRAARGALRKGGRLIVLTPNAGSVFGLPYAFGDFTHEVFFTGMSLAQVASGAGYDIVHIGGIRPGGLMKGLMWGVMRRVLAAAIADRNMQYGGIMERELIGVFANPGTA